MEFIKETEGAALVVKLSGRLDTNTAKQFEQELFGEWQHRFGFCRASVSVVRRLACASCYAEKNERQGA